MSKRLNPGEEPGARSKERNPMARPGTFEELQNLATFLMAPGQCDWLTGQSIMMDGGNALANGSGFYDLRNWSDAAVEERARAHRGAEREGPSRTVISPCGLISACEAGPSSVRAARAALW